MKPKNISRRGFMTGAAAAAGMLAFSHTGRRSSIWSRALAQAATPKPALLVIFKRGGYNACMPSADSFFAAGSFGVSSTNVSDLGNGLVVDKATLGSLPAVALKNIASIGVRHGSSSHGQARMLDLYVNDQAGIVRIAAEMGGSAAIKCACLGQEIPDGDNAAINGVSLQSINDMSATIAALGGGADDPNLPARALAMPTMVAASAMSAGVMQRSPKALVSVSDGYRASIDTLSKPVQPFRFADLAKAYGLDETATAVDSFSSKMAAAELMIVAGANVCVAVDEGWDSHGDSSGTSVRNKMVNNILPGLRTFLSRMLADSTRNVVTVIMGDFSRSLPGSDHQPNLTATVIGRYVKLGTTGKVDAQVALPADAPAGPGLWAYLAAVLKLPTAPFGANPHPLVL